MSCIDDAVRRTSANWRPIQEPEKDYNLVDVLDLAGTLQIVCRLVLGQPSNNLSEEEIVQTSELSSLRRSLIPQH